MNVVFGIVTPCLSRTPQKSQVMLSTAGVCVDAAQLSVVTCVVTDAARLTRNTSPRKLHVLSPPAVDAFISITTLIQVMYHKRVFATMHNYCKPLCAFEMCIHHSSILSTALMNLTHCERCCIIWQRTNIVRRSIVDFVYVILNMLKYIHDRINIVVVCKRKSSSRMSVVDRTAAVA